MNKRIEKYLRQSQGITRFIIGRDLYGFSKVSREYQEEMLRLRMFSSLVEQAVKKAKLIKVAPDECYNRGYYEMKAYILSEEEMEEFLKWLEDINEQRLL